MTSIPWNRINTGLLLLVLIGMVAMFASRAYGGPLDPPGAPSATVGVLEPGTPISSLPFTISTPGYYYLTRNLDGIIGSNGITIESNNVTLDLKGFQLTGPFEGGSADDDGVEVTGASGITIRNGTISSWHGSGILFSSPLGSIGSTFYDLHLSYNFQHGMRTGDRAIIHDVTATNNGLTGISTSRNAVIERCIISDNQDDGIRAPSNATITDCSVVNNAGDGIQAGQGSIVRGNTVSNSGGDGVQVSSASVVEQNTLLINGQLVLGAGVNATGSFNRIVNNLAAINDYGFAVAGSALTTGNYAANNGDDYGQVLAGPLGPVLDVLTIDDAGANPHANFR